MTDLWRKAIDKGLLTGTVFLDLSKPIDCVDHSADHSAKLPYYGVRGQPLSWLTNYLQGRQQRVRLLNEYSGWGEITHGVPQGSILGPLLFCIYINDLPSCVSHSRIHLFADDTPIQYSSSSTDKITDALYGWMQIG